MKLKYRYNKNDFSDEYKKIQELLNLNGIKFPLL